MSMILPLPDHYPSLAARLILGAVHLGGHHPDMFTDGPCFILDFGSDTHSCISELLPCGNSVFSPDHVNSYSATLIQSKCHLDVLAVDPGEMSHSLLVYSLMSSIFRRWLMVTPIQNLYPYPLLVMSCLRMMRPMQCSSGDSGDHYLSIFCTKW